jgi:four helix bundle protein
MGVLKFEDLIAWRKSQDLAVLIYSNFKGCNDLAFRDQLKRAAVSISNNIAEGFDRSSRADFSRFLYFSLASCSEVKSMLYLAHRLNYISIEHRDKLLNECIEVSKILTGLIKSLK